MPTDQEKWEQIELVHQLIDQADWGIVVMGNGEHYAIESFYPPGSKGMPRMICEMGLMDAIKAVHDCEG